jgi:putative intracellular protease/amidase
MANPKSILMVVTSHDRIDKDHPTGLWFEEFAVPYGLFREQGYRITVASPRGGAVPIDPRSEPKERDQPDVRAALEVLAATARLDSVLPIHYDAIFFPGGHGTMYDLPENPDVSRLVGRFADEGKVVASVCHGPACFVGARRQDGTPVVQGKRVTAFTNAEESAVELDKLMPFLLESRLRDLGARFEAADNWADHVVVDGRLVTGQNPQSSGSAAREVIRLLS